MSLLEISQVVGAVVLGNGISDLVRAVATEHYLRKQEKP